MNKKFLALMAVTVSSPVLSFADTPNVNVYGTLNISAENVNADPQFIDRNRVQSNSSNFGVKGTEDLGGDMKGIFQVEVGFDSILNRSGGTVSLRNTGVGINGGFGQVMYGLWDTPFKTATMFMEPFYGTGSGTLSNLLDSPGANTTGATQAVATAGAVSTTNLSFHRRQGNNIQYWSPVIAGLQAKVMYSANGDRETVPGTNPDLWSASLGYNLDSLTAVVAYDLHHDFHGTATNPKTTDTGLKAALGYKLGDTQLGLAFSTIKVKTDTAAGEDSKSRPAYGASVIHNMGDFALRLGVTLAGTGSQMEDGADVAITDAGATNGMFGFSYNFSKRTAFYGEYAKIWNQDNAQYTYMYNPIGTLNAGVDPQTVALGFRHTFQAFRLKEEIGGAPLSRCPFFLLVYVYIIIYFVYIDRLSPFKTEPVSNE